MDVAALAIPEVIMITPRRFSDNRGFFSETYNARVFKSAGVNCDFVQDNQSYSAHKGTVRGLHYQAPPHAQSKLIRVLHGAIIDVAVDARAASPTYGQWVKARLSAEKGEQLFVPAGFLHGFVTLAPDTQVAYKVGAFYDGPSDGVIHWNDPTLNIDWGISAADASLSEKDATAPSWAAFASPF